MINVIQTVKNCKQQLNVIYSQISLAASKLPFYYSLLAYKAPANIFNKLSNSYPTDCNPELFSKNDTIILKCSGRSIPVKDLYSPTYAARLSSDELRELHSFDWMDVLNMDIDRRWRILTRDQIHRWIAHNSLSDSPAWTTRCIAARLFNWILQYNTLSKTTDFQFKKTFARSLMKQFKLIRRRLYLPLKLLDKTFLVRGIVAVASATHNRNTITKAIKELNLYLSNNEALTQWTSQELVCILRNLLDIKSLAITHRINTPEHVNNTIATITSMIRVLRQPDGGLCWLQSTFTPSIAYIDHLLSKANCETITSDDFGYIKIPTTNSFSLFINSHHKHFPIECCIGAQRIILGEYISASDSLAVTQASHVSYENKNVWFVGTSSTTEQNTAPLFTKKIYVNNLGTDIRCEESWNSSNSHRTKYIILPEGISVSRHEITDNAFLLEMNSGIRFEWHFDQNADVSFEYGDSIVLNGNKINFTLLKISLSRNNSLKWRIKTYSASSQLLDKT